MDRQIADVYSQSGGDLPYFEGRQMYGSGWLRTLGRMAFPILKRLGAVAANTASDVLLDEKPLGQSLISNVANQYKQMVESPPRERIPKNVGKKRGRSNSARGRVPINRGKKRVTSNSVSAPYYI